MSKAFDEYQAANPARAAMIAESIHTVIEDGLEVTPERVAANLPSDFGFHEGEDFLNQFVATETGVTADMGATGDSAADRHGDEAPDQLRERVVTLDRKASDLRGKIYTLRNRMAVARGDLADAIS